MIYIGNQTDGGCSIYLDVHAMERERGGIQVSAVIGDGSYEGDVLIHLGSTLQVTFVDELWGDLRGLRTFLDRHGKERILEDLKDTLSEELSPYEPAPAAARTRPHVYLPLFAPPGVVAETSRA